jgi:hypothetical protein
MSHVNNYFNGGISTSDAVPIQAGQFTLQEGALYILEMTALARQRPTGGNAAYYRRTAIVKNDGATVTVVATDPSPTVVETAGAAAWNASVAVSGEQLVINVQGGAGQDIDWNVFLDGFQVGPF